MGNISNISIICNNDTYSIIFNIIICLSFPIIITRVPKFDMIHLIRTA